MIHVSSDNINKIQLLLFDKLLTSGQLVKVGNYKTQEIFPVSIQLTNIRKRCTTISARNWNIFFALGELCWHLSGSRDPEFLSYYTKNWELFKDVENNNLTNCYGYKIFKGKNNQWDRVKSELLNSTSSRRALISLNDFNRTKTKASSQNKPCTTSLQFLIRENKLHLIVNMRSNDIIWGLPNDIFVFTMLQELMANELNVGLGIYTHFIGSLHLYERHFSLASRILKDDYFLPFEMLRMGMNSYVKDFIKTEKSIRENGILTSNVESKYWNDLLDVFRIKYYCTKKVLKKSNDIFEKSIYKNIINQTLLNSNCESFNLIKRLIQTYIIPRFSI